MATKKKTQRTKSSLASRGAAPRPSRRRAGRPPLPKAPTGIPGFDELTNGGLPAGRPTLVCGGPGCGKTIFGIEFLVRGIDRFDEPGVLIAFEENVDDLAANVASLGYDLAQLQADRKLAVDHVYINPSDIQEAGSYTLDGLFVRIEAAVASVKAKRIVIDTLEVLFASLRDEAVLRAELQRLFRWLRDHDLTAIVTAERGQGMLTRHGLEEYVSDCVILLDTSIEDLVTTRRLRVVKYRGSSHGTNEYPFLIDAQGISVLPLTSVSLDYEVSRDRIPTGVADLDEMLGGEGYFRTSTILVSGSAGTGKSALSARLVDATCRRGERAIIFAFEESPSQMIRNMRSLGVDLERWRKKGLLEIRSTRPSLYGLEMHLLTMHKQIDMFGPQLVVVDPISSLITAGTPRDVKAMMVRLFDALKKKQITGFMTYLTPAKGAQHTDVGISSLIDTWIEVRDVEVQGERTRGLYVIKSRGMSHSNQVREMVTSDEGIRLVDVYPGPDGILTGSARVLHDARLAQEETQRKTDEAQSEELLRRKEAALRARIAELEADHASDVDATRRALSDARRRAEGQQHERDAIASARSRAGGSASLGRAANAKKRS
ncbi:MAG: circadian clock protein KaiC [Labilithrix sp.]|nr:circadian clock protein KaiC [Labilithrix sp.]